jgi:hypothetical protein
MEKILKSKPIKWILLLLGSVAFTVLITIIMFEENDYRLILGLLLFVPGILISLINLFTGGPSLIINDKGFRVKNFASNFFMPWNAVEEFAPVHIAYGQTMVGFNFTPQGKTWYEENYPTGSKLIDSARSLTGVDGAISDNFGMKTAELAELLNEYKAKYSTPQSNQTTA